MISTRNDAVCKVVGGENVKNIEMHKPERPENYLPRLIAASIYRCF